MPTKLLSPEYGLSKSKLEECNASSSDVRSGKTFYSGDKNKKTGNLVDHGHITDVVSVVRATDQSLGDRAFIRIQPGVYTTLAGSGYPEVSIPFYDLISQLGADRGQYQYAGGIGAGTDENGVYYALNAIPEGYYRSNGADWAPEVRISEERYIGFVPGGNRGAWNATINPGDTVKIPQGYHSGGGYVWAANTANPNMTLVNRSVNWGSGVIFSGDDTNAPRACQFGLQYYANSTYNVHIEFRIYRNNSRIDTIYINREGGLMYDPRGYIAKWYEGSGTYKYDVNVTYHAGNGTLYIGGMIVGY